jgi:hypothetical protein
MDLGTIDTTGVITAASVQSSFFFPRPGGRSTRTPVSPTASFTINSIDLLIRLHRAAAIDNIVRVGLNY